MSETIQYIIFIKKYLFCLRSYIDPEKNNLYIIF